MNLQAQATIIADSLAANGFANQPSRQALALAEEVGEFVGAFRRWSGQARRSGTWDDVVTKLADVVITAYVFAAEHDVDLDAAIDAKLNVVLTRGWRELCTHPDEYVRLGDHPDVISRFEPDDVNPDELYCLRCKNVVEASPMEVSQD